MMRVPPLCGEVEGLDEPIGEVDAAHDGGISDEIIDCGRVDPLQNGENDEDEEERFGKSQNPAEDLIDDLDGRELLHEEGANFPDEPRPELDENDEGNKADDDCAPACGRRPAHGAREAEPTIECVLHRNAECEGKDDGEDSPRELADAFHKAPPYAEEHAQEQERKEYDVEHPAARCCK